MTIQDTNTNTNMNSGSAGAWSLSEWDQFLEATRPDIGHKQTSWWAEFQRQRGWDSFSVVAREAEAICGGATVLIRSFAPGKCYYYIPHGPVLPQHESDAAQLFDELVAYIDEHRKQSSLVVSHLRLEPRWLQRPRFVQAFRESVNWHEPRITVCVDLTLSEDDILSQMKKKGRYNIRVAARHDVSIVEDNSAQGLADFISLYKATVDRQAINRHSTSYFYKLASTLFPLDRGSIYFAEYQGRRLATAWMIYSGETVTYKYGGSLDSNRNVMAPYLLHFEIIRKAKANGFKWYDFYGVSPLSEPKHKWANFSAFKRKFGGREFRFVPALDLVYHRDAYREFELQMLS